MKKHIKPVFKKPMNLSFMNLLKVIGIICVHVISIAIFFTIIESIDYFQFNDKNILIFNYKTIILIYLLFVGPFLTAIFHIIYLDTGNISAKTFV